MATIKDVARESGYTVTTVSRMLNNRSYVSAEAREKITQAMEKLNYSPNELARGLSKKKSNLIGLIIPNLANPFFCAIAKSIEEFVSMNGYKLMLCCTKQDDSRELEFVRIMEANNVSGVIIATSTAYLDSHIHPDMKMVAIERPATRRIPSVRSDNHMGGYLAGEHLIQQGCRKLAYINGSSRLRLQDNPRFLGFAQVCDQNGIPYVVMDAPLLAIQQSDYSAVAASLLEKHPDVTGVFASNDDIAAQLIQTCSKYGVTIPEQLKIVGYDDIFLASLCTPSLTTIQQPIKEICRTVVNRIFADDEDCTLPSEVVFPVKLIVRDSTVSRR